MAHPSLLGWIAPATRSHTLTFEVHKELYTSVVPKHRIHGEGTYVHYVTFSCYKRRKLLLPDICKRIRIGTLGSQLRRQHGICLGIVIMLDHVHAMVWFPDEHQISACMNKWKELTSKQIATTYAREFPKYWSKLDERETVWQARYYDFNLYSEKKMHEKLEYMHNNPVRAGLAKDICDWPWSSARWWHQGKSVGIPISWHP